MDIALVAPPFIPVPPVAYGGTELFIAHLAEGLRARGHTVTVYANGESRVRCNLKWRYRHRDWPISDDAAAQLKNADHTGWAVREAARHADLIHVNDIVALPFTRFVDIPCVVTLHHPHAPALTDQYLRYPAVRCVAISTAQARREPLRDLEVAHHGIPVEEYRFRADKSDYVAFLGRMAPCKGVHLAIDAARRAGLPLKLAGEIQPVFREYWDRQVAPRLDGVQVEYLGEANMARKNEILSRARALLFPIQWEEPFGLVLIESMACGTPVVALRSGSVPEIVRDGVSGWACRDVEEMTVRLKTLSITAESCRAWAAEQFSCRRMVDRYLDIYARALEQADHRPRSVGVRVGAWPHSEAASGLRRLDRRS
jgi:glycosyltransferase involved in cell wall biosynthesis